MSKPLIIQVVTAPSGGGAEYLVRELAHRLPSYNFESKAVYFSDSSLSRTGAIKFEPNELAIGHGSPRSITAIQNLRKILKRSLDSNSKVLVHTHLTWPFFYTPIAATGLALPLLHTEHDSFNRRRSHKIIKPIDSWFYSKYQKVFCISQGVKNELHSWIGDSIVPLDVIENGIALLDWVDRPQPDSNNLLKLISVGSLTRKKGFDIALKAVAEARDCVSEYKIVGEGPERRNLELLVSQLNLQDIVKLPGWSNNVEAEYAAADLQLIPSRWEGFGLVAVEGMSTGLPLIAADVSGLREVVGTSEFYKTRVKGNYLAWALAIGEFHSNLNFYKQISYASRKISEKFTIDKMVAQYAAAYSQILDI